MKRQEDREQVGRHYTIKAYQETKPKQDELDGGYHTTGGKSVGTA